MTLNKNEIKLATKAQETLKAQAALRLEKARKAKVPESQEKKLTGYFEHLESLPVCFVLASCGYDATLMNTEGFSNPYTIKKMTDFARFNAGDVTSKGDNYDRVTFKTMFALVKAGINKITKGEIKASMAFPKYASQVAEDHRQYISKEIDKDDSTVNSQWSSTKQNFVSLGMLKALGNDEWSIEAESFAFKAMAKTLKLETESK